MLANLNDQNQFNLQKCIQEADGDVNKLLICKKKFAASQAIKVKIPKFEINQIIVDKKVHCESYDTIIIYDDIPKLGKVQFLPNLNKFEFEHINTNKISETKQPTLPKPNTTLVTPATATTTTLHSNKPNTLPSAPQAALANNTTNISTSSHTTNTTSASLNKTKINALTSTLRPIAKEFVFNNTPVTSTSSPTTNTTSTNTTPVTSTSSPTTKTTSTNTTTTTSSPTIATTTPVTSMSSPSTNTTNITLPNNITCDMFTGIKINENFGIISHAFNENKDALNTNINSSEILWVGGRIEPDDGSLRDIEYLNCLYDSLGKANSMGWFIANYYKDNITFNQDKSYPKTISIDVPMDRNIKFTPTNIYGYFPQTFTKLSINDKKFKFIIFQGAIVPEAIYIKYVLQYLMDDGFLLFMTQQPLHGLPETTNYYIHNRINNKNSGIVIIPNVPKLDKQDPIITPLPDKDEKIIYTPYFQQYFNLTD
jgi:hypothetical protein